MASTLPRRYRPAPRVLSWLFMLAAAVGTVVLAGTVYPALEQRWWSREELTVALEDAQEIPVTPRDAQQYGVLSAARALDGAGRVTGYVVITARQGYASEIQVQSTFAPDGERLAGIRVLSQQETEYLGARIASEGFAADFAGRRSPFKLWGSAALGSPVDGLSGSTISAQAVVDSVNAASAYLQSILAA